MKLGYLSPVVLEHDHTGLGVHPSQREGLLPVAPDNHGGHHFDWLSGGYSMFRLSVRDAGRLMSGAGGHQLAPSAQDQALSRGLEGSGWPAGGRRSYSRIHFFILQLWLTYAHFQEDVGCL